ncbi:MAG TPA: pitrilysin family protein [Bryobacteraceae bacterium]|nr:pitrilysin family protein [Bryobacteraceae bacterium]HOL70887.1 pitrilysin family protein [Bryobacteraceae bacterium]HOQ44575.1 pitrilysin family protein [Bryobacteraceae bacterium]HPQ14403.1 pitrilysin family protein [Bryobacteraceae bacterium]HPU70894.1 pitrilysin family protein [Bryobacteraceae bacterium]
MKRLVPILPAALIFIAQGQTMDLTKPPKTPDLPVYKLPPVYETTLPNGLTVLLVEDRRFPLVTARLGFQAGSKYDPKELAGLSESTAALLTEGTTNRTSRQIAEEVASIGGALRGDSSADSLVVAGNALAENFAKLLNLLADVARNANFPEEEVELRKQNRKQELLAQRSEASFLADEKFAEILFSPHPYARQDPTPESIDRLNREALVSFRDRYLIPNNAVLVLLGAIPPRKQALEMIQTEFGSWQRKELPAAPPASFPEPQRTIVLVDRPGSVQADLRIGRLAVTRSHPDYFPLLVGNTILGGGASSRIFMNIREKKGFAYDARSTALPLKDAGTFAAITQVRNEVLTPALEAIFDELKQIAAAPVSADELTTAQNYLSGVFVIRLETQDGLAGQLAGTKLMGLPLDYLEKYTARVRAVTPAQISAVAAKYIHPDKASIVVVGDASQIAKQLERFGKVTIEQAK